MARLRYHFARTMELFGHDGVSFATRGGVLELSVPSTPAQRALDLAEAAASMRAFYISLGMRPETLRRTIALAKTPPKPLGHAARPQKRGTRAKAS